MYAAWDPKLNRQVALKVLHSAHASDVLSRAERSARLLREAVMLARLSHPNVVAVHEAGEADGQIFIALELVKGVTLADWARSGRREDEVLRACLQAGQGLAAAHAVGVVHRDFKPTNALVSGDGRVRVCDFGLAGTARSGEPATPPGEGQGLTVEEGLPPLTLTGEFLGTPAYVAPELFAGAEASPTSDQFSFCVTCLEVLTGQRPAPSVRPRARRRASFRPCGSPGDAGGASSRVERAP